MGYGGKLREQQRARELRAQSWTMPDIAKELGVSKSSVSLWVRDVDFVPNPRRHNYWTKDNPHPLQLAKEAEIERCDIEGRQAIGRLTDREFLVAGLLLYSGEGAKRDGTVKFANTNPDLVRFFSTCTRGSTSAQRSHSGRSSLQSPPTQFTKPYRAMANNSIRHSKHLMGCPAVVYAHALTHRRVMGLIRAITSNTAIPG